MQQSIPKHFKLNSFKKFNMLLFKAIHAGDIKEVARLLKTPMIATQHHLELAVSYGHLEIVILLLTIPTIRYNAAVNNNAILRLAIANDYIKIAKLLLQIPAIRDNAAANNNEALRLATSHGHLEMAKLLLKIPKVNEELLTLSDVRVE